MRVFAFLVLEVLLSPITLTGYCLASLWAFTISQQQQLSITALSPLFCRWLLHLQGTRPDPAAHGLMKTLPSLNEGLNWAIAGPTLLAMNASGYTPSLFQVPVPGEENLGNMINTRTLFFDQALEQYLNAVEQVVILGAGFDTRLFKYCLGKGLSLFEVDQAGTQKVKIQALRKSGRALEGITFVTVDFNREDWMDRLVSEGFERGKRSFFLWEGVTYYLTEASVKKSLQMMSSAVAPGSAIAFDFFSQRFIQGENNGLLQFGIQILDWIGEPFCFGVDISLGSRAAIAQLLESAGCQLHTLQMMGATRQQPDFCGLVVAET